MRELRNLCERLCALFPGKVITREELPSGDVSLPLDSTGVDPLYTQLVRNGVSFWKVVAEPFLRRELNRAQVRAVIARGLQATQGRYTELVRLFGLPDDQYHRFYKFLSKHHCRVDFRPYRQPLKK